MGDRDSGLEHLDLKMLITESKAVTFDPYSRTYPHLVSYFAHKETLGLDGFVQGTHMVYGWMPTILKFHYDRLNNNRDDVLLSLNLVKNGNYLDKKQIESIVRIVNNSVVGTSKLLHFIAPENYPIWDSKIYGYYNSTEPNYSKANNVRRYLDYAETLKCLSEQPEAKIIQNNVNKKLQDSESQYKDYKVTFMRAIDMTMFQSMKRRA